MSIIPMRHARICEKVRSSIDIIEIGTPMIIEYSMSAVRAFRKAFPEKEILADAKIMDAGEYEADQCFAARGFSNRLMHLGLTTYFIGEPTTPSIGAGDLLVIGSGSGTTASLAVNAKKAKAAGAKLATLTIFPQAEIGSLADVIVTLLGATPKRGAGETDSAASAQPMGNLFEQLSWLTYDSLIMELMGILGETAETMFPRHANLE